MPHPFVQAGTRSPAANFRLLASLEPDRQMGIEQRHYNNNYSRKILRIQPAALDLILGQGRALFQVVDLHEGGVLRRDQQSSVGGRNGPCFRPAIKSSASRRGSHALFLFSRSSDLVCARRQRTRPPGAPRGRGGDHRFDAGHPAGRLQKPSHRMAAAGIPFHRWWDSGNTSPKSSFIPGMVVHRVSRPTGRDVSRNPGRCPGSSVDPGDAAGRWGTTVERQGDVKDPTCPAT